MRRAQLRLRQIGTLLATGLFIVAAAIAALPRAGGIRWF